MAAPQLDPKQTLRIFSTMQDPRIKDNLYAWVMYAFPWGVKGTPLEKIPSPHAWQKDELDKISAHIANNKVLVEMGLSPTIYKSATCSGRGPGKSALLSWLALWFQSCILGGTVLVSANNDSQLSGVTFAEISKWKTMCLSGHWFERLTKEIKPYPWFVEELIKSKTLDSEHYHVIGKLWDEDRPDAFAGVHNQNGLMVLFDEASGIPEPVWGVTEGFFTDVSIYRFWFAFSNPRRNTGAFYECFHPSDPTLSDAWNTRVIDSRDVESPTIDKNHLNNIIKKHGEESDYAKIEVRGLFPSTGESQFISRGLVNSAVTREFDRSDDSAPLVMGVDPARFGQDATVIRFRQGRDAKSIPPVELQGKDNMVVANKVAELIDQYDPDGVFIDVGAGTGIIDRLREMKYHVHEVDSGSKSGDPQFADHRTEVWGLMRDWLEGGQVDDHKKLKIDLCAPEYYFTPKGPIRLESKDDMKKRKISSTDHADALAFTFSKRVARRDTHASRSRIKHKRMMAKGVDYKIFGGN